MQTQTKIPNIMIQNILLKPKFTEPHKFTPSTSQWKSKQGHLEYSNTLDKLIKALVKT